MLYLSRHSVPGCILSGPGDFLILRSVNFPTAIFSFMSIVMMVVWHLISIGGMLEAFSAVVSLLNSLRSLLQPRVKEMSIGTLVATKLKSASRLLVSLIQYNTGYMSTKSLICFLTTYLFMIDKCFQRSSSSGC